MGDHRAEVKCELTLHGKTYMQHWSWINWDIHDGIDSRVTEWFRECSADALARYDAKHFEAKRERQEEAERAEYQRLKAKYEAPPHSSTEGKRE